MTTSDRQALIARYKDGHRVVLEALAGASEAELDRRPAPGKWTAREIVHHLADSEMTSAVRLRRLIAEDNPLIVGYDQEQFARTLRYDRPIAASLDAFRAARLATGEILDRLSEEDWRRTGTHSEAGPYSVERWLEIYAAHAHNHADQIRRARAS
jgi:DinB superfamily